jgi:hypothetical protein
MRHPTLQMMDCALIGQSGWIAIVASYFVYVLPLLLVGLMQDFDTAKRVAKPKVCSLCGSTPATEGVTWHRTRKIGALHSSLDLPTCGAGKFLEPCSKFMQNSTSPSTKSQSGSYCTRRFTIIGLVDWLMGGRCMLGSGTTLAPRSSPPSSFNNCGLEGKTAIP